MMLRMILKLSSSILSAAESNCTIVWGSEDAIIWCISAITFKKMKFIHKYKSNALQIIYLAYKKFTHVDLVSWIFAAIYNQSLNIKHQTIAL